MTTEKQIGANQQNALMSTGPVTAEGKAIVSQNAVKHGIFTKNVLIKSGHLQENPEEYQILLENFIRCFSPKDQLEYLLVEKIAVDFWRLNRLIHFETNAIIENHRQTFSKEFYLSDSADKIMRYEKSLHHSIIKNIIMLRKYDAEK